MEPSPSNQAGSPRQGRVATTLRGLWTPRSKANAALIIAFLAGGALVLWPEDFLSRHQELIGVSIMGVALAGTVFVNGEGTVRQVVDGHRMELGSIVLMTFFALGLTFVWEKPNLGGIGVMGVIVLLGTMLGGNLLSHDRRLSGQEVRTAIAVSTVTVFFGLIAFGSDEVLQEESVLSQTFAHFWQVLIYVMGFYFGGVAVEQLAARRGKRGQGPGSGTS